MTPSDDPAARLRVAVVGAGPAGIYAADILMGSDLPAPFDSVSVDILEQDPTPFGLIRYGVAPDHPRIKEIVKALHRVMETPGIRFIGNVQYGRDIGLDDLRAHYHAVVFATGARRDRALEIPGAQLQGSYGAADFVAWYDGHPDFPREWDFRPEARSVAVIGAGNVGLDIARILAKTADELLVTEIADNVHEGLRTNAATDVHLFARRGPAQVKFTPMELRELSHSPTINVIVHPEGADLDEASELAIQSSKSQRLVVDLLMNYVMREPTGAPHRIHIHFCSDPVEIVGEDGRVVALRTSVTELDGTGNARPTGEFVDWPVQAVYRAIGYLSDPLPGLPFDDDAGVVPNDGGRVVTGTGIPLVGAYVTGWIKRGPVGLIGHTKSDAARTISLLLEDAAALPAPTSDAADGIDRLLEDRGVIFTTWEGWRRLDAHELSLGESHTHARERVKVVPREAMVSIAGVARAAALR